MTTLAALRSRNAFLQRGIDDLQATVARLSEKRDSRLSGIRSELNETKSALQEARAKRHECDQAREVMRRERDQARANEQKALEELKTMCQRHTRLRKMFNSILAIGVDEA